MELVVIPLAKKKLQQRGIPTEWVEETVGTPGQRLPGYGGRVVYQRRYQVPGRRAQLLRVVCEETQAQRLVVTAYLTSDIQRYWRA